GPSLRLHARPPASADIARKIGLSGTILPNLAPQGPTKQRDAGQQLSVFPCVFLVRRFATNRDRERAVTISQLMLVEPCRMYRTLTGTADPRFPMDHSMRTMPRTIALAFVRLGLASAPLAAQANPPPPSNPPGAQPTGPQYQGPPPQAPQAQSPQPQGPQYSSNEIVDAGHRFFGTISSG